ncbi:MAG: WD40 repeat domain-containing serine/threonine protein kinase [Planctomycetaceae bacterium]
MNLANTHNTEQQSPGRPTDPVAAETVLRAMLVLANELHELHRTGQIHRDVSLTNVAFDWAIPRAWLTAAVNPEPISFGGLLADHERCPPEMRRSHPSLIPPSIDDARRVLAAHGILTEPERIDLYQFGTLLCRQITGRSIQAYLSSPGVVFRIPAGVRRIIDGCIGYDELHCVESASQLIELMNDVLGAAAISSDRGQGRADTNFATRAETRTHTRRPPFERLGHFEIQEEIGHGGMGTVYRAFDRSLDRAVAVKVLSRRLASDPTFVKRFQAEAAAAARLAHPNVVPIFFIGEDAGRHFYAMRFINGESLADRLHREPSISASEVLAILQQVLLGLAAAHRMGLVHRDIKPGNILIDRENGLAMLTDFGLARSISTPHEQSETHVVMGTAEYMSPEQAQGEPVDPRSDLYSVGVLLYQLLSGDMPFDADTPSGHLIHHVCTEPRPLHDVVPDVDPQLEAVVMRLLRKRPDERYPSVEELLIDLDVVMDSDFASSADSSRPLVNLRPARSSRVRRRNSDEIRLAGASAETAEPVGSHNRSASDAATTVSSQPAPSRSRRAVALAMAGMLVVVFLSLMNARSPRQAAATTLQVHQDAVSALAFSPDGNWLLSGGGDSSSLKSAGDTSLRLWNARTGQLVTQSDRLPVRPRQLLFLNDSRRAVVLASAREETGTMVVWDTHNGVLGPIDFSEPFAMHFDAALVRSASRDPSLIAAGRNGLTRVSVEGVAAHPLPVKTSLGATPIRAFAVCHTSSGPQTFVALEASLEMSEVVSLESDTGRELVRLRSGPGVITALAVSNDGRWLVTRTTEKVPHPNAGRSNPITEPQAAFDFVRVWDWSKQAEQFRFGPYAPGLRALAMTSDGHRALTIAEPSIGPRSEQPQEAVWLDLTTGQEICRFRTNSKTLTAVALSPSATRAALADADGQVVFCDLP